jgi:hypothetical protein
VRSGGACSGISSSSRYSSSSSKRYSSSSSRRNSSSSNSSNSSAYVEWQWPHGGFTSGLGSGSAQARRVRVHWLPGRSGGALSVRRACARGARRDLAARQRPRHLLVHDFPSLSWRALQSRRIL